MMPRSMVFRLTRKWLRLFSSRYEGLAGQDRDRHCYPEPMDRAIFKMKNIYSGKELEANLFYENVSCIVQE